MSDADAPRHTIDSPIRIGKVHPKARKQFNNLSRAHQQLLLQKVNRELAPTEYKMYRGSHIRKHRLYHAHVTDNIVFNFLLDEGEGIVVFIGKHKDTDHAADQFHKQSLDLSGALRLDECGLLLPPSVEHEGEPMADSPPPRYGDEGQTHPDLVDVAGLLDSSIRSLVGELLEESFQRKLDALELRVDQQELDHEAIGSTVVQEQTAREELGTTLQTLLKDLNRLHQQLRDQRQTDTDAQAKLHRQWTVTAHGVARIAATVSRLSAKLNRIVQQFRPIESAIDELADATRQSHEATARLSAEVVDLQAVVRDSADSHQRLRSRTQRQANDLTVQVDALHHELHQSQERIQTLNDQLETQAARIAEMEKQQIEMQRQWQAMQNRPSWWQRFLK